MAFIALSMLVQLVCVICFGVVLVHAFRRSLGTGVMVLCLPIYQFVYGFKQFEHRYKGVVLAGWLGGTLVMLTVRALALRQLFG